MTSTQSNPTLHPRALTDAEKHESFKWHSHAGSPRSSQVFCLSAFGTLRSLPVRDRVLESLFRTALPGFPERRRPRTWTITPEAEDERLLSEYGTSQPTSVDALCLSSDEVVCIESKFATDAAHGFGGCGQFPRSCAGHYGPGSDLSGNQASWCRLENWKRGRSPRAYWSFGRQHFRPEVFSKQVAGEECPLRGSNYQLMRNFLFAAAMAERDRKSWFGVLTIAPRRYAGELRAQVAAFRERVLLPHHSDRVSFLDYESYCELLRQTRDADADDLAEFLESRIDAIIGR